MAMAKLKVFRTPIGFHDAYVAAPSQKAALAAWGADADLFARGAAEKVTDPALMEAPLADPGKIVKVSRGGEADHFRAVDEGRARKSRRPAPRASQPSPAPAVRAPPSPRKRPKPRPSRAELDRAEDALAQEDAAYVQRLADIAARKRALDEERRALQSSHGAAREKLEAARDKARTAYHRKVEQWASA